MKGGSFKKLFNSVTQNPVFLYLLLVVAVFNLLVYLQNNNLAAVVLFLVTGYVTTLYTKNMSIILLSAIMITSLLTCLGYLKNLSLKEGLKNGNGPVDDEDVDSGNEDVDSGDEEGEATSQQPVADDDGKAKSVNGKAKGVNVKDKSVNGKIKDKSGNGKGVNGNDKSGNGKVKSRNVKDNDETNCLANQHYDEQTQECVANGKSIKNSKNKGGFANIEETDFTLDGKPTMNYRGTVETAYNSLEDLLGSDGVKNMSLDTAKLTNQQDQLMEAMNQMEPMMKTASKMMEKFNGMGLGNLLGGSK